MLDREYVAEVSMMNFENESVESLGAWAIAGGCCRVCPMALTFDGHGHQNLLQLQTLVEYTLATKLKISLGQYHL